MECIVILKTCLAVSLFAVSMQQRNMSVAEAKTLLSEFVKTKSVSVRRFTIEGFLFKDPQLLLLNDPKWSQINTPMPDTAFILFNGKYYDTLTKDLDRYQGKFVIISGYFNPNIKGLDSLEFIIDRPIEVRK